MPRTNAEMSDATRKELLQNARAAFAEHGYSEAPIEAVVRAAGMTKGALYHHFGSKQGLFVAVVRDVAEQIAASVGTGLSGAPTKAKFLHACTEYLLATQAADVRRILLIDAPAVLDAAAAQELENELGVAPLRAALAELKAEGELECKDIDALAHVLNGALNGIALWAAHHEVPATIVKRGVGAIEALLFG
jgi:AcrR family transcriptional regulator